MLSQNALCLLCLLLTLLVVPAVSAPGRLSWLSGDAVQQRLPALPKANFSTTRISKWLQWYAARDGRYLMGQSASPMAQTVSTYPQTLLDQYSGQLVLRFNLTDNHDATSLLQASEKFLLDVWALTDSYMDLRIAQDSVDRFLHAIPQRLHSAFSVMMDGVELAAAVNSSLGSYSPGGKTRPDKFLLDVDQMQSNEFFREYRPLSVLEPWMQLLQTMFASHVRLVKVGQSSEGREILALSIGVRGPDDDSAGPRKTIAISGGSHAREWISVSTASFIAHSLIIGYGKETRITKLLEQTDFLILPTLNPDGYSYSWEADRLWRKNRQPTSVPFCPGIDLDRAFGYMWDVTGGSPLGNPCSESYSGEVPYEAVEARAFSDWAQDMIHGGNGSIIGFLDLHSYSQQILMPYSFSCLQAPPTLEDLEELGEGLAKAIRTAHQQSYDVIRACKGNFDSRRVAGPPIHFPNIESAGGSPLDWAYHELKVRSAYQIKLRDTGGYGFLLPSDYIVPTGEEVLNAVLHFGRALTKASASPSTTEKYV